MFLECIELQLYCTEQFVVHYYYYYYYFDDSSISTWGVLEIFCTDWKVYKLRMKPSSNLTENT